MQLPLPLLGHNSHKTHRTKLHLTVCVCVCVCVGGGGGTQGIDGPCLRLNVC